MQDQQRLTFSVFIYFNPIHIDRAANIAFSKSIEPEAIFQRARKQHDDAEEEELVGSFMRGDLWITNPSKDQLEDRLREETMQLEAAKVLQDSKELQADFLEHHIGQVDIPPETSIESKKREIQEEYIERIDSTYPQPSLSL